MAIDKNTAVHEVVETGKELLNKGLVARTWGNVSARVDDTHFLITPSGLDYVSMRDEDIVQVDITSGEWEGKHKPSGERGVHKAAYIVYPDVNFVIHTHQTYATAIGLAGFDDLDISDEEKKALGGIAIASYGMPGMKKLTSAVETALKSGAKVIFMIHHGALICGSSKEDAMNKALLLEEICQRNCKGQADYSETKHDEDFEAELKSKYENAALISTPNVVKMSYSKNPVIAQMDDTAQMVGRHIPVSDSKEKAIGLLEKYDAVLIKGLGAIVKSKDVDDLEALKILMEKTAVGKLYTDEYGVKAYISSIDAALMHFVYTKKYAKQKEK